MENKLHRNRLLVTEGTFSIDIPVPARPVLNKTGILYGN